MGLINEKELINNRPENLNPNMSDEIKSAYNKGWNACNSEWINLIDEQPTTYDIDEIVNKLEELVEKNIGYMRGTPSAYVYIKAIKDAIDAIKGGVE